MHLELKSKLTFNYYSYLSQYWLYKSSKIGGYHSNNWNKIHFIILAISGCGVPFVPIHLNLRICLHSLKLAVIHNSVANPVGRTDLACSGFLLNTLTKTLYAQSLNKQEINQISKELALNSTGLNTWLSINS